MNQQNNRLLVELEHSMRTINREVINPEIQSLTLDDLRPMLSLVANARARYIKELFSLGTCAPDGRPTADQFDTLAQLRCEYDELASAAKALETAIQRGYLDIVTG